MKKIIGLTLGVSLLLLSGCNSLLPGKVKEEDILVEKDKAKELEVDINLGAGELILENGAKDWVEGNAEYNNKKLAPDVKYDLHGDTGEVVIEHKGSTNIGVTNIKNKWDINLNEDIPMDLSISTGASVANLNLQGLILNKLNIETGVGDLDVDLGGDWKKGFKTNIETGVGSTTVILPSEVGVIITSEKGIASSNFEGFVSKGNGVFVNDAYENADVVLEVNAEIGVGEVSFKLDK